ncbi:MAG: lipopolysaccharide biosynthesis protein [Bacteroidota bacterium]|jgi:O-antigen/teichoic acid export membrane protein
MSNLKTITRNTFLYTISSVLQRASSIIFFPIFSSYLTKGDYGIQGVIYYIAAILNIIGEMQLSRVGTRLIYDGNDVNENVRRIYGMYFIMIIIFKCLLAGFLYFTGPYLLKPFLNDISFDPYVTLTLFALPATGVYGLYKTYLQATDKGTKFIKVDMLYFLSNVLMNLYFIIVHNMGVSGLLLSTIISSVLFAIYAYYDLFRNTYLRIDFTLMKESLRLALPLLFFILLGMFFEGSDKIILNSKLGKDVGGIFYIATMLAAFFNVFRESSNQALIPWFYREKNKTSDARITQVLFLSFGAMCIVGLGISYFSYEMIYILSGNKELISAYRYTPLIIVSALIVYVSQFYYMIIMFYKIHTRWLFLTTLSGWLVNMGACYLLIDYFGIYGAALGNMLGVITLTIVKAWLSKISGYHLNWKLFTILILATQALSLIIFLPIPYLYLLPIKIAITLMALFVLYHYANKVVDVNKLFMEQWALIRNRLTTNKPV